MLLGLLVLPALVFGAASEASVDESVDNPGRTIAVSTCTVKRPETRILVLEDSFKYCKILSETPSSSSALLKLDMAHHFQLGYQVFSIPALDMCLEYQKFPDRFATIEKKREFLGKLFDLGIRSGKSAELISALKHTLCKDALKDLGPALSLIQLKWLNKFANEVLFENVELLASLNDYSWITLDRFNEFMLTRSSYILNWMRIKAFIATANEDVLTEAMFYHFHPSVKDQVLALRPDLLTLERLEKDIRLYPVAVLANLSEMDYIGSKLICTDLDKNGLTRYNLAAILLYVQMTDFICVNELNQIGFAWCKAHEGFSKELEESLETTKARHAAFNEAIQPHLSALLGISENRQVLWEEVQKISACEEAIAKFKPEWKENLHLILRNPVNMVLRLALSNLSNLALHLPIHPDDYDLEIPLPRCIFTGPQPPIFVQATSPFLINSVLRNVFFLDGESWREDALREGVDLTSQNAVSEFMRNKMNFFYKHSNEPLLHSEILQTHFKFRLICRGIVATGPLAVRFYAESLGFSPDAKENEKLSSIYEHVLSNIIIRSFTEADLDFFDRFFKGNQKLVDLVEGLRSDLQAEVEDYPFHGEGIVMHYLQANCSIVHKVDAEVNQLWKVFTKPDPNWHVKELNLMRGVQVVSNLMLALGPKLTPPILLELWSMDETFRVLSAHENILSRSQFKSLFDLEIGKTFLILNQFFVARLKDFSFLTEELLLSSKVELRDFEASLTSLPLSMRKSFFSRSDQKAFQYPARVAIVLGADFWHLPEIRSHQQAWEMIDLIAIHADSFKNEYDFLSLIMDIVPKLPDSLEEAKPMILKWLIHMDWQFILFHTLLQKANAGSTVSIHLTYNKFFDEECLQRVMLSEWLEAKGADSAWIELTRATFSPFRAEIIAALKAGKGKGESSTPYEEITVENAAIDGEKAIGHQVVASLKTSLTGMDSTWWNKLDVLQQFTSKKISVIGGEADRLLNELPTFDAAVYLMILNIFGIYHTPRLASSTNPLKYNAPSYNPSLPFEKSQKSETKKQNLRK